MRCLRPLIALCCLACVGPLHGADDPQIEATTDLVGRWRDDAIVTPVNQRLTPFGRHARTAEDCGRKRSRCRPTAACSPSPASRANW